MSFMIAAILLVADLACFVFSLHTHRDVFNPVTAREDPPRWSVRLALGVLFGATALVAVESEILVTSLEGAIASVGITELFAGGVVVAIIGNAADHGAAALIAWPYQV